MTRLALRDELEQQLESLELAIRPVRVEVDEMTADLAGLRAQLDGLVEERERVQARIDELPTDEDEPCP